LLNKCPTSWLALVLLAGCLPTLATGGTAIRELDWFELMPPWDDPEPGPPDSMAPAAHDEPFFADHQPVEALDGLTVRLPGYIVPLESDEAGLLDEFLLVPYFGACIHVPPPPPNQLVYVRLSRPFYLRSMEDPYWVTGTLHVQRWDSDFAEALYRMEGQKLDLFR